MTNCLFFWAMTAVVYTTPGFAEAPTTWNIKNDSSVDIKMSCKRESAADGLTIASSSMAIPANGTLRYEWGDLYFADGMGLNPGRWTCVSFKGDSPMKIAGSFSSNWGEHLELTVIGQNSRLEIIKAEMQPGVAIRDANPGKKKK